MVGRGYRRAAGTAARVEPAARGSAMEEMMEPELEPEPELELDL